MTRHRNVLTNEKGFALFYMAVFLTVLLIFVGLAVDTGRAYVVQAQLSKAVDGAALGAARMLNSGNPQQEAAQHLSGELSRPATWARRRRRVPARPGFFTMTTDADDRRQRRQRPGDGGRADDLHEAGELHTS